MRRTQIVLIAFGLAVAIIIVARFGAADVAAAFAAASWGIAVVALSHLVPLAADTAGWRSLLIERPRPSLLKLYSARWVGESVNNLLPAAQVGGELVRIRLAIGLGTPGSTAASSVIVDVTIGLVTQLLFAIAGLVLLFNLTGADVPVGAIGVGLLVFAAAIAAFYIAQRRGAVRSGGRLMARLVERVLGRDPRRVVADADQVDSALHDLYRHGAALARCAVWRMTSWFGQSLEVWLALYFLGYPLGLAEAVVFHSLVAAVRSAVFFLPGALGVQEAGFLGLGVALGLSPEVALALALVRRAREVLLGVPGLALWWAHEAKRAA